MRLHEFLPVLVGRGVLLGLLGVVAAAVHGLVLLGLLGVVADAVHGLVVLLLGLLLLVLLLGLLGVAAVGGGSLVSLDVDGVSVIGYDSSHGN